MDNNRTVSLTISLSKTNRTLLRRLASEWMLSHPDGVMTAAAIARDVVEEFLEKIAEETRQEKSGGRGESQS